LKTKFPITAIILFLGIGAIWLLTLSFVRNNLLHDNKQQESQIDMFMHDVNYVQMDQDGLPVNELSAPEVKHFTVNDEYLLTKPELKARDKSNQLWHISAISGKSQKNQTIINLYDQVKISEFQNSTSKDPILEITTNALTFYPETNFAETKEPLTINQVDNIIEAVGGNVDLKNGILKLFSKVKGKYRNNEKLKIKN